MNRFRTMFVGAAIITLFAILPGCADLQAVTAEISSARDQAAQLAGKVAEQSSELRRLREAFPDHAPEASQLDALIAAADAKHKLLEAAITKTDLTLAEAQHPTDGLTRTAAAIGSALPPGTRAPLVLGAAFLATLFRARQLKSGAASIVQGIATASETDDTFRQAFERHASIMRGIQSPVAQRIVDDVTKPRGRMRLPV